MSTTAETSKIDRLMADAREAFAKFRDTFLTDAFVADPYQDLEWLRQKSVVLRDTAAVLGLNVFAEIVRCLESSLEGLIKNHCELSDSLLILIRVAEDALDGHTSNDLNAPALVQRASIEYRRMRNLPKNGDSRAIKQMLKRLETQANSPSPETTPGDVLPKAAPNVKTPSDATTLDAVTHTTKSANEDLWKVDLNSLLPSDVISVERVRPSDKAPVAEQLETRKSEATASTTPSTTAPTVAAPVSVKPVTLYRAPEDALNDLAAALLAGIDDLDLETDESTWESGPPEPQLSVPLLPARVTPPAAPASNAAYAVDLNDDKELVEVFIEEVTDHCRSLSEILAKLHDNPSDSAALNDARRRVHSIKGSAGVMGWQVVARLSHRTEDLLERLAAGTFPALREGIDLLQCCVDALAELLGRTNCDELLELIYERFEELGLADPARVDAQGQQAPAAGPTKSHDNEATSSSTLEANSDQTPIDPSEIELDNLADISAEMREIFTEEAEDHLRVIYAAFAGVEQEGPKAALIRDIRRSVHTLKGAAGAVGFRVVGKWGHRMEDILDRLQDVEESVSASTISLLYRTTDAIQDLVHGQYDQAELRQRLAGLLTDYASHHAAEISAGRMAPTEFEASLKATAPKPSTKKEIKVDVDLVDFEAVANSARSVQARTVAPKQNHKSGNQQLLRVPIERLDALAQTVSELVINRSSFEQKMADLIRFVAESQASVQRLRGISYNLESEYGVKLLGGQRHFVVAGSAPAGFRNQKQSSQPDEFDSLEFDRYGEFHVLTRSLAETTTDIDTVGNELRSLLGDIDSLLNRQGRLAREAQNRIMGIRMVPLATLTSRLQRTVRVVAQEQGKQVALELVGEYVELDKLVLEEIIDPLMHILRNAVDHGIELPEKREASGKLARATIRLHAYHQGTQVVLHIQDDGRGLDYEKIRDIAIQNGVLSQSEAECSTEEDLQQLIYVPGFSTASKVSEISGRGVGMDVVRDKVQKLKGTIETGSQPGQGTSFTIRLPMTMAITRALLISANQETFALPIQVVQQILRIEKKELSLLDDDSVIRIKDRVYPVIRLADRLNLRQRGDTAADMVPTLLVSAGGRTAAIVVDRILSSRDIVVKTLGSHLQYLPGLIGATLLGDGTVVPILDAVDLVGLRTGRMLATPAASAEVEEVVEPAPVERTIKVMIVDDSVSVRRVMSNLVKNGGMIPIVAKDGVDALGMLQSAEHVPDIFLLDIEMPRMDGFELLATLRGQQQHRETPIVMITSRAGDKHRAKAAELGASQYLTKPFRDQELLETIRTLTQHESLVPA